MNSLFRERKTNYKSLILELNNRLKKVYEGGGQEKAQKQRAKGKMSARARTDYLLDNNKPSIEIGALCAYEMYAQQGGCPSGGVIVKMGYVSGRLCLVVANDATVKAGAWFPMTAKKNLRAQEIAMENLLPIIYLVDSAGVYLPLQADIFADKEHFGRIFRNNARMSALGILQIAAVMGSCVAGGAYLPVMSDELIIVDKTANIFLAGSYLVKAAIGETIDNESLGGATTHCEISGVADYKTKDDKEALDKIRNLMEKTGAREKAGFDRAVPLPPLKPAEEIYGILPESRVEPYDMREIIERLVDNSAYEEYKALYGKTLICSYARIEGWAVGIIANQRKLVKNKKGEIQFGGVIYSDSADKAARFIANCNQKKIPLVFLQDVTGFMVGSRAEQGGIIKDGAKMVNAVANSVVPKFTIMIGNSYGAGNYAMCGKAYDPRLIFSWPSSKLAVMGEAQATQVLLQMQNAHGKSRSFNNKISDEKQLKDIQQAYQKQTSPYYAAARLWSDAIIDPLQTRLWISIGIEAAQHSPITERFTMGVVQT
ncbi:acyl-CoA carboxylase subunit beta [Bacteroidetes bacterium endosymbiont of Geopemphigus sp.]|uniref:acyl-CoA carboxylase subunit beta n=1 Tax=Bacteroidetes bacterium endosymbiont of Geopemphigus sp. TaxID=2047937 RepID=UPI000CD315F2|nr:carboxyl transferase domain-containing protein [Bacteroidetes bacterium endosymbiont of Geopemphigus sp.]